MYLVAKLVVKLASIAQEVERFLGKEEVSSSSLDRSSIKALESLGSGAFARFVKQGRGGDNEARPKNTTGCLDRHLCIQYTV